MPGRPNGTWHFFIQRTTYTKHAVRTISSSAHIEIKTRLHCWVLILSLTDCKLYILYNESYDKDDGNCIISIDCLVL